MYVMLLERSGERAFECLGLSLLSQKFQERDVLAFNRWFGGRKFRDEAGTRHKEDLRRQNPS